MKTKTIIVSFLLTGMAILVACDDGVLLEIADPSIQRKEDIEKIEAYLLSKGYSQEEIDTTDSGVRYVILEEGTREAITESDIVYFNYIGYLTNDTIFDTSIQSVADSIILAYEKKPLINSNGDIIEVFSNRAPYIPLVTVYSRSGWTITGYLPGFIEGLAATFGQIKLGGKVLIVMPSGLGYGRASHSANGLIIPPNSILAFELSPVRLIQQ